MKNSFTRNECYLKEFELKLKFILQLHIIRYLYRFSVMNIKFTLNLNNLNGV
jgi:hypothetical protein